MLLRKVFIVIATAGLALVGLAGCNGTGGGVPQNKNSNQMSSAKSSESSGNAATIAGVQITETQISDYINRYRILIGKTNDVDWATFMDESETTAEKIREEAIIHFAENILVKERAAELGLEASDAEVNAAIEQIKQGSGITGDSNWTALLETSGYDEQSYREDIKTKILKDKLCTREVELREATAPEMLSQINSEPDLYTGKAYADLVFPSSGAYAAEAFISGNSNSDLDGFMSAAARAVDSGQAIKVVPVQWQCLSKTSWNIKHALSSITVGEMVSCIDDDGSVHVLFASDEFMSKANGSFSLTEMPEPIREKLKSDASNSIRSTLVSGYLKKLVQDSDLDKKPMPNGLSYDVSIDNSEYGEQKTKAEQEAEAQNMINEQMNQISNTKSTVNEEALEEVNKLMERLDNAKDNSNGN